MKRKNSLITIGVVVGVCAAILITGNLKIVLQNYAKKTYYFMPLYFLNLAYILLWATVGRIVFAYWRKPFYKGALTVNISAVVAASLFLTIGILDWIFGNRVLLTNQLFDIFTMFSVFCILGRHRHINEKGAD